MKDLIEALTIFAKYNNVYSPTHCEHDCLYITDVTQDEVSYEDKVRLKQLGFFWASDVDSWASFRFGSG